MVDFEPMHTSSAHRESRCHLKVGTDIGLWIIRQELRHWLDKISSIGVTGMVYLLMKYGTKITG
jgi:hypothetical protein